MMTYDIVATDRDGRKLTIFKDIKDIQSAEHMKDWFKGQCYIGVKVEIVENSINEPKCVQS